MKNEKNYMISSIVLIISLIFMLFNFFIISFNDTIVRVVGIIMLIDISVLVYSVKKLKEKS